MFIKVDMFEKLLCCRRKVVDDEDEEHKVVEEVVLQHTNNNKTEYISSAQLVERLKGGTTAVVALVREKRLVVAWLGDSQALLVRRRNPVRMVEPHKPELPVERERVEEMGGCVINIQGTWRVLGQLAVSRAIGDADYKPFVSSECDIKSLEIEGDEDFLILACDGLWDTLNPDEAVNIVYAYLTHNDGDTDGVGRCLVEAARSTGSEDNITAVVVFLRPVSTLMEEEAARLAQGQVPDPVPAAIMQKDTTPASINAIFSPPLFTTPSSIEASTPPPFVLDGQDIPMDTHAPTTPPALDSKGMDEPQEGWEAPSLTAQVNEEGITAAVGYDDQHDQPTSPFSPHNAPTPTAEEVDAALAELDSIPDEVCESGDVEEEEEEEEEWSYFRMEPQTQPQSEDILVQGAPTTPQDPETEKLPETSAMVHDEDIVPVEQPNTKTLSQDDQEVLEDPLDLPSNQPDNLFEASVQEHQELLVPQLDKPPSPMEADQPPALENTPDILQTSMDKSLSMEGNSEEVLNLIDTSVHKVDNIIETNMEPSSPQGSLSPRVPGSPRSVEGFITSVELNTPEESFATNFAVNQHRDMFANNVDQSSGPFSVYVSSSPEPASLDPSLQGPVDLINMSGGMTNGQLEETTTTKTVEESPVEIVHAQSTVEVVAPPSPVDVSGPETQFIMPDQMSTSITGALPSDLEFQQSELSFIPEPVIEPMAEKPVPVYVEDTTPISEPELLDYTADDNIMKPEPVEMMTNLPPEKDVHMEKEFAPASPEPSMPSPIEHIPAFIEPTVDIVEPAMNIVEPAANIVEPTMNIVEPAVNIVEPAVNIVEPTAPVEVVSSMLADSRISESSEKVEVISEALAEMSVIDKTEVEHVKVDIPVAEVKVDPVAEVKVDKEPSKEPAVGVQAKSPGKTPKTGAKPTPGKTPTPGRSTPARSTPGKSTPAKPTPGKATPSRTPSTKTPTPKVTEKRTPTPKPSPKVPNKAVADKPSSRPAAAARTTTKPTTTGTTRPATTRTTASKAPATKSTPPTRTTDKAPAKPSASARTTTRPATTGASKPAPTRTTPTSRTTPTMTKRPTTAPTKPTDKTDSGRLVNGTGTRPSTARSTTTATTRKPATSTARTNPKPAAEKETKNTTNRILSTSRSSASTARTTTNKTAAAKTDAKTTSRVNGTSTTAKSRTATATRTTTTKTSGVGAKKMVSKKTDQIAGKTTKTEKTEAAVIETTPPLINGENKIADEETSVEVLDKCVVEDIMHTSAEKIITETSQTTSSSEQVVVTTETTEVIVNGDH